MTSPAWNINSEYASIESAAFTEDFAFVENAIATIEKRSAQKDIKNLQDLFILKEKAYTLAWNMSVYLQCTISVDSTEKAAKAKASICEDQMSRLNQACISLNMWIKTCDEASLKQVLAHPELQASEFTWDRMRKNSDLLLSEKEETLLEALNTSGHDAWGNLYSRLCGSLKCELKYPDKTETVGLSQAAAMVRHKDEATRKVAWNAVQEAWSEHRETSAAIVNALAGWRHEVIKKRSYKRPQHFLDSSLHYNRNTRETLEAIMTACHQNLEGLRKAPLMMAKIMKKPKLDPWDLVAPSPLGEAGKNISFSEGMETILYAFNQVDPQLADFANMMVKNQWIDGRVLPNKSTGGYCTEFEKSLTPRIFMTYMGSDRDVVTLAHELGHAYHSWVMRDMPRAQRHYPMTLAETASVFAETALRDVMMQKAKNDQERLEFGWSDLESAASYLINIPVRFDFEKSFYEKRMERTLSPEELSGLMDQAWNKWYGPTVSNSDPLFWASKLHFSIPGDANFYNYPYTFGYLFSLSIYARRKELGSQFMKTYVDILRDTGRMTAEDLVQKHLGEDIRRPEFWQKSLNVVLGKLNTIEKLI
ncbi:M3 family oligoendopeptidase [Bdellovibrio sp. HCB337]|uniref:M3 family oligoendopeptidase n=1 Tax=Bdellovibrio sp. HCB337 TaxID=3394358 RepID=UPI0039A62F17